MQVRRMSRADESDDDVWQAENRTSKQKMRAVDRFVFWLAENKAIRFRTYMVDFPCD
jgi:hypothetical protein